MVDNAQKPLSILYLLLSVSETSAPYNEHCLASVGKHDVSICTYFKPKISPPKEISTFEGDGSLKGFFRVLKAALDETQYDIVHAHSPHVAFLILVASAFVFRRLHPDTVYTFHSSYQNYKLRNRLMLYPVAARFGRIVCCSNSSLESLPRFLRWLAGERLCAVQNGADIDRVDHVLGNRTEPAEAKPFTVATVGRLIEIKRPISVLNAYKQGSNGASELVFIGEGDLKPVLTAEISRLGLENQATTIGLIPRDELFAYLAEVDLFVSASRGEGLPVAVLEAMACRCPVILSDIPPHREIVAGDETIPLIHPDNVKGFAEEIRRFQSMSSSERSRIGRRCRRIVEDRFSLSSMQREYEKVYLQFARANYR